MFWEVLPILLICFENAAILSSQQYSKSGSKSAPLGHTIVPTSLSTDTLTNSSRLRNGSYSSPYKTGSRLISRMESRIFVRKRQNSNLTRSEDGYVEPMKNIFLKRYMMMQQDWQPSRKRFIMIWRQLLTKIETSSSSFNFNWMNDSVK